LNFQTDSSIDFPISVNNVFDYLKDGIRRLRWIRTRIIRTIALFGQNCYEWNKAQLPKHIRIIRTSSFLRVNRTKFVWD